MKYVYKIIPGVILFMGLAGACKDDDSTSIPGGIAVDKEEITIGPEGGTEQIAVTSYSNWVAGASKPWIFVSPANGSSSAECQLAIDSTLENTARTSQIRFALEGQEAKLITVTQFGFGKQIIVKEPDVKIESSAAYDKRLFEAVISSNVNFLIDKENIEYSFAEAETMTDEDKVEFEADKTGWITPPKDMELKLNLDRKARPRTVKAKFRWEMNTTPYTRIAKIRFVPQNPGEDQLVDDNGNPIEAFILTVTQKAAPKIEDNRSGDSLAIITINEKIQSMISFDTSENMQNWDYVTLWEATDKDIPEGAVGRVRSVKFSLFNLQEGEILPKEVRYLKYLESFEIQSNSNNQTRIVSLGEEICELKYLKSLTVFAYGMEKLPDNFIKLGGKVDKSYRGLEKLDLSGNNFPSLAAITEVVNEENFPELYAFNLTGCRRSDSYSDLSQGSSYNGRPLGLHIDITSGAEKEAFLKLLTWDKLRSLRLSYNFIEGQLPTDDEVDTALQKAGKPTRYQDDDFSNNKDDYKDKLVGDTCIWLKTGDNTVVFTETGGNALSVTGKDVPRVLPKARSFSINLNFLTGPLPKWILFHPYFAEWGPEILLFNQQENGKNSAGAKVGFNNIDAIKFNFEYYYGKEKSVDATVNGVAYPWYYQRYVSTSN